MRRGRSGIGGWRNENPRHFRPRGGSNPHFRPPRNIAPFENHRFPLLGPRPHRGPYPYNTQSRHPPDNAPQDQHDRSKYRINNLNRQEDRRHHSQSRLFVHQNVRKPENFYEDVQPDQCLVNNMGDVDHRHLSVPHTQEPYGHHSNTSCPPPHINPWNTPFEKPHSHFYTDQSPKKSFRHQEYNESTKLPIHDYPGHRPPSSDHYDATPGPTANNNNTSFTRSVDDTVDIVRRRLLNRNDPQRPSGDNTSNQVHNERDRESVSQPTSQEPPAKKRTQRQRQNDKSNCDKMKTKIVHQLFKMDKDKMHKLMDNPSSSTKFEYAISSLITESQNSLNRHMRSVAEKSLYSSSTDFIHNDNNTIYEDTFMKQMQCILDPQDTVLLEDIKPIVMAELSKVLQLNDFETKCDEHFFPYNDNFNSEIYAFENSEQNQFMTPNSVPYYIPDNYDVTNTSPDNYVYNQQTEYIESKPIFERRPAKHAAMESETTPDKSRHLNRKSIHSPETNRKEERKRHSSHNDRRILRTPDRRILRTPDRRVLRTPERRESVEQSNITNTIKRESIDERIRRERLALPAEDFETSNEPSFSPSEPPLFEGTAGQLSDDDDDPFAELDKQYHVAVDHNFIENDDIPNMTAREDVDNTVNHITNIKKEVEQQTVDEPTLKQFSFNSNNDENTQTKIISEKKKEEISPDITKENNTPINSSNNHHILDCGDQNSDQATPSKITDNRTTQSHNNTVMKSTSDSNARKRSIDQRPSHRKEKRKKSESSQSDSNKQILNKNIIINVNDCAAKSSEKDHDTAKSVFNSFFSKGGSNKEISKDNKKQLDSTNKSYSDKYVKRKDSAKKANESEKVGKKRTSSTSSHSIASPNDGQTTGKQDTKVKLKTIDMFMEQPKKVSVHQAHRNTAVNTVPSAKTPENKSTNTCNKFTSPEVSVVIKKMLSKDTQTAERKKISKFCQTERKKLSAKWVQTDPICFEKPVTRSDDTFERMKEIDMEIQVLLQEKFKLYSSIESKDSCHSTMPSLGMTVLSMTPNEENIQDTLSADEIIDDFTNIPVEELEQIALESVQDEQDENNIPIPEKPTVQHKVIQENRKSSQSPKLRTTRKAKTPNISLIEQIITDDRPLEDIISLEDLEVPVAKPKKKTQKQKAAAKKNLPKKGRHTKSTEFCYDLKECSVVLVQSDISQYLTKRSQTPDEKSQQETAAYMEFEVPSIDNDKSLEAEPVQETEQIAASEVLEESVVNDIQFDMLDVSEDIVIGDVCEIKCTEDNDRHDAQVRPISEEIILDNSQSSCDAVVPIEAGQVENICKTYDYSTDEKLRRDSITVTGNADAVLAVECIENDFIAACLDGNVYHFNNEGQLLNTLRGSNLAVTCLTIVKEKYGTTVYTGSLDSRIRYYDLKTGLEKGPECNVLSPIQTMDRAWDTIFVGTRTGFVLQFECKNNMLIPVSTVKFSDQSILALRALKEGPRKVLLVAARSESVTIKDAQSGLLLRTLSGPKMTVYTLLFEDGKVYCGTSSHQIHVFDYASGTHTACHEGGKGAVCLRASGGLLFAGCYDGCVYVYRDGDARPMAQLRGPSPMLLSLAIVGTKIIAGYKDRSLYIWKLPLSILQEMIL